MEIEQKAGEQPENTGIMHTDAESRPRTVKREERFLKSIDFGLHFKTVVIWLCLNRGIGSPHLKCRPSVRALFRSR